MWNAHVRVKLGGEKYAPQNNFSTLIGQDSDLNIWLWNVHGISCLNGLGTVKFGCIHNGDITNCRANAYRIQNYFSTLSTKILEDRYYFRDFLRILECKFLWITHIFAIYSDLSVVSIVMVISAMPNHQFWWFLVWFICGIAKIFANSCDFHSDYICFFASTLAQFGYHF